MTQDNSDHTSQDNEASDLVSRVRAAIRCQEEEKAAARLSQTAPFSSREKHGAMLADLRQLAGTGRPTPRRQPKQHTLLRAGLVLSDQDLSWSVEWPLSGPQPRVTQGHRKAAALAMLVCLACLCLTLWTLFFGPPVRATAASMVPLGQDGQEGVQSAPLLANTPVELD